MLTMTYKCIHNQAPTYLKDLIKEYEPSRTLRSASQHLLAVPVTRLKSYGDRSFAKAAPSLWNELPLQIRESDSLDIFKSRIQIQVKNSHLQ